MENSLMMKTESSVPFLLTLEAGTKDGNFVIKFCF
ncbi:hypothetical protein LINPERHAP1_LOCUS24176 [Linum perenne]